MSRMKDFFKKSVYACQLGLAYVKAAGVLVRAAIGRFRSNGIHHVWFVKKGRKWSLTGGAFYKGGIDGGIPFLTNFFSAMNLTIFFAAYMVLNWWNMFNARVIGKNKSLFDGLGKNKKFSGIMVLILIVTIIMVQVGGEVFRTEPLTWQTWGGFC